MFDDQWHLLNTGQFGGTAGIDINVTGVWDDYTGAGVVAGIVDDGVEYTHVDLDGNYDTTLDFDYADNDDDALAGTADFHGTAVAGLVGAESNGQGVVGAGFDATITGFRVPFGIGPIDPFVNALAAQVNVDISNNSYGFIGLFADNFSLSPWFGMASAVDTTVTTGRGGLGTVIVFSAGNDREIGDSSDYHSLKSSRFTISVAAVDNTGEVSFYSNPGASLLVAAPSSGDTVGITTRDRTGANGYDPTDYTSIFGGTSAAAPIVSGTVALMLEANPNLGYRDVQEILAYSATQVDSTDPGWAFNAAKNWNGGGLHVSHDFGFGLVDAHAAVRLAETWTAQSTKANELNTFNAKTPNLTITDNGTITDTITVGSGLNIDHVEVFISITHPHIGDLVVKLTSPDGTESVLVNRPGLSTSNPTGSNQGFIYFAFDSTNHWGESGAGTWTLSVSDQKTGDVGTLDYWSLKLFGDLLSSDDLYVYTDEFGGFTDPSRTTLSDTGGTDTLNAAAITTASIIDLTPGANSTLDGNTLTIAAGTTIEHALAAR